MSDPIALSPYDQAYEAARRIAAGHPSSLVDAALRAYMAIAVDEATFGAVDALADIVRKRAGLP